MSKKYKIGLVGFAHMHVLDQIKPFLKVPERVEWIGCADVKPLVEPISQEPSTRGVNMKTCIEQCSIKHVYEDYHDLLDRKPDIVLCNCENAFHGKVISEILMRGIHTVVEKPLAYTMEQMAQIERASRLGKASIITNWPVAWEQGPYLVKKLLDEGAIGKPYRFQYRNADSMGPFSYGQVMTDEELGREWWHQAAAGGGSMLDYCCYGSMLAAWCLNAQPQSAFGLKANFNHRFGDAEDYANITVKFPEAVAILEGTWNTISSGYPSGPIVWGEKGALILDNGDHFEHVKVNLYKGRYSTTPDEVYEVDNFPLPKGRADLAEEVLHHLDTGEPLNELLALKANIAAAQILDAGVRSAASGKEERTRDINWTIG